MSVEKNTLQWLAPSMIQDGLVRNEPWVVGNAEEAEQMVANERAMQVTAVLLAAIHADSLSYIQQAPVLILAATRGRDPIRAPNRRAIASEWLAQIDSRPPLKALFRHYGIAKQLRVLRGHWLTFHHHLPLKCLSALNPSLLAQGQAMHHCVATYANSVIAGRSRIYSIRSRENGRRIATMEIAAGVVENYLHGTQKLRRPWRIVQVKGPCNERPSDHVLDTVDEFVCEKLNNDMSPRLSRKHMAGGGIRGTRPDIVIDDPFADADVNDRMMRLDPTLFVGVDLANEHDVTATIALRMRRP